MLNIYLFIELLGSADSSAALGRIKALQPPPCRVAHAVELNPEKLVAQVDCPSVDEANVVLRAVSGVEDVVQTNIIAVVKPRR